MTSSEDSDSWTLSRDSGSWSKGSVDIIPDIDDVDQINQIPKSPLFYYRGSQGSIELHSMSTRDSYSADISEENNPRHSMVVPIRSDSSSLDYSCSPHNETVQNVVVLRVEHEPEDLEEREALWNSVVPMDKVFSLLDPPKVAKPAQRLGDKTPTKENSNLDFLEDSSDFINLVDADPRPDTTFTNLMRPSHILLCQMTIKTSNVPFLIHSMAPAETFLKPPFVMFPDRTSVVVAKDESTSKYTLSARGPLLGGVLTHLFSLQGRIGDKPVVVQSFAYRDVIPAMIGNSPFQLDSSILKVKLDKWRESFQTLRRFEYLDADDEAERSAQMPDHVLREKVLCEPGVLDLVSPREGMKGDDLDILEDTELRAVLELTDEGNDISAIFPTFSDDAVSMVFSDDGLGEEINALEEFEGTLRRELETADMIINGVTRQMKTTMDNASPSKTGSSDAEKKLAALTRIENDLKLALRRADQIIRRVNSDEGELDDHDFKTYPSDEMDKFPCLQSSFRKDHRGQSRKVRFSKTVEERTFLKETPTESEDDDGGIFSVLADVYFLVEDFVEEMGFSCAKAAEAVDDPVLQTSAVHDASHEAF